MWRGKPSYQLASDLFHLARLIHECRPAWVIETGGGGGTSRFLADVCDLEEYGGEVLPIRQESLDWTGLGDRQGSVMAILDSDVYNAQHMLNELLQYAPMVTSGQHLVVCHTDRDDWGSAPALRAYLGEYGPQFQTTTPPTPSMNTYLRRM